ncbi:sulfotransferase family protein [Shimia isoporae]|uniref:Sulfotransferase family protein n=1 Tax=Shimia isoporae TaxID=647720 RepID=A0A4R1N9N5_9RHOB|nr:sulfotransferase family 2 domain-containing protein [Shimia isoporae]TCK99834.1 sulfotransferase family protein [Shimia isoporae]
MPIARISGKLIYFAHVPKCAGTSVERYLVRRFGKLAFHDTKFGGRPNRLRWTKSSPQHVPLNALNSLFPNDFFDASFAVVRHPIDRLASAFLFQREIEGQIPDNTTFGSWLEDAASERNRRPFAFDNHVRAAVDFIPENADVFRLEDGLEDVVFWLDRQAKCADGPREIGSENVLKTRLIWEEREPVEFALSSDERELVYSLYEEDFVRFGYERDAKTKY